MHVAWCPAVFPQGLCVRSKDSSAALGGEKHSWWTGASQCLEVG